MVWAKYSLVKYLDPQGNNNMLMFFSWQSWAIKAGLGYPGGGPFPNMLTCFHELKQTFQGYIYILQMYVYHSVYTHVLCVYRRTYTTYTYLLI